MKEQTKVVTEYIANDGIVFNTKRECEIYEKSNLRTSYQAKVNKLLNTVTNVLPDDLSYIVDRRGAENVLVKSLYYRCFYVTSLDDLHLLMSVYNFTPNQISKAERTIKLNDWILMASDKPLVKNMTIPVERGYYICSLTPCIEKMYHFLNQFGYYIGKTK